MMLSPFDFDVYVEILKRKQKKFLFLTHKADKSQKYCSGWPAGRRGPSCRYRRSIKCGGRLPTGGFELGHEADAPHPDPLPEGEGKIIENEKGNEKNQLVKYPPPYTDTPSPPGRGAG